MTDDDDGLACAHRWVLNLDVVFRDAETFALKHPRNLRGLRDARGAGRARRRCARRLSENDRALPSLTQRRKLRIGGHLIKRDRSRSVRDEALRERIRAAIADHCLAIEDLFVPGAKVTVLVRNPSVPGDADVLVTSDTDVEIVAALERRGVIVRWR